MRLQKCVYCHAQEELGVLDKTSALTSIQVLCTLGLFPSPADVISQLTCLALRWVYHGQYSDVG